LEIQTEKEQQILKSLFLNEEKADITFKVQDKQFPAHREVLLKKSKYFAQLLNSGQVEFTIEIQDCDEQTFKGLLFGLNCELIVFFRMFKSFI